ncbi:MAG: ACP S-malonyltransferase [Cardiobacteriaceae bacterium]|nr:ACP S-malonyltransferase [Cardiobacteriaceae bacterium]
MLAIVFPGQGSQSVGMCAQMAEKFPDVKKRFDEASQIVGTDLWNIAQNNPDDFINRTEYTQPILLTACYATFEVFQNICNKKADFFAGHSLGEYTALLAAGAMSFSEAVKLVHIRGKLMQEAVPFGTGAMAAIIGLNNHDVAEVCSNAGNEVFPANFNAPGQVVIGGKREQVENAVKIAKEKGAKRAVLLPVSVPSHTPLIRSAAAQFSLHLDKIDWKPLSAPVIFNVDCEKHSDRYGIEAALGKQLYSPVLWRECITKLADDGVSKAIEIGAGKVLSGLIKRIDPRVNSFSFDNPEQIEALQKFLSQ